MDTLIAQKEKLSAKKAIYSEMNSNRSVGVWGVLC